MFDGLLAIVGCNGISHSRTLFRSHRVFGDIRRFRVSFGHRSEVTPRRITARLMRNDHVEIDEGLELDADLVPSCTMPSLRHFNDVWRSVSVTTEIIQMHSVILANHEHNLVVITAELLFGFRFRFRIEFIVTHLRAYRIREFRRLEPLDETLVAPVIHVILHKEVPRILCVVGEQCRVANGIQ